MNTETINQLESVLPQLGARDASFATDLIGAYRRRGTLTPNQAPWVERLIERATGPKATPVIELGGFGGVIELFNKARENRLKFPKITLVCQGQKIVLSLAGPASKNAGSINVAGEGRFPNRQWFGRVSPEGKWEPSRTTSSDLKAALHGLLSELAADPAGVATRHGSLTGHCAFCNLPLKPDSAAAGFGPVCAEKYGLKEEWKRATAAAAAARKERQ